MTNIKLIALAGVATLALSVAAHAADNNFTSHHLVDEKPYKNYTEVLSAERKYEVKKFLEYQQREPSQFYRPVPEGFIRDGCSISPEMPKRVVPVEQQAALLMDYEVHFAFDSATIDPAANDILNRVARDIKEYRPNEVTVAGYTDTAGSSVYNVNLSQRRAHAISAALDKRSVKNRILEEEAYGETHLAVNTPDGVPLRENRRVVIEFRK